MYRGSAESGMGKFAGVAVRAAHFPGLRSVVEPLKRLALLRAWRDRQRLAYFLSDAGHASYYGVFASFSEARRALPRSAEHNQSALATEYIEVRSHRVYCYDYPMIHWLGAALGGGATRIFDIGGSVGVHYRAYRRYLAYPPWLSWQVCEVPAIAQIGRELAQRDGETPLTFTDALNPGEVQADVWISAGAIHYIEKARPDALLAACQHRPAHLLLNKLPLYEGDDFVSAQNMGANSFAPLHIYNRQRLVTDIESVGYRLVDSWEVPERHFYLPDHPEKSFGKYSGLYFRATAPLRKRT